MTVGPTFVWDASGPHHPGKAGRLDLLGSYVGGRNPLGRHVVTQVVADELALYGIAVPDWCELVPLDTLDEVTAFARWTSVLASGATTSGRRRSRLGPRSMPTSRSSMTGRQEPSSPGTG